MRARSLQPHNAPQADQRAQIRFTTLAPWRRKRAPERPIPPGRSYSGAQHFHKVIDGVIGKWAIKQKRYGQHFNAVMFRQTAVSAEDAIELSREIYAPLEGKFNESNLRWQMPSGGRVSFKAMERNNGKG